MAPTSIRGCRIPNSSATIPQTTARMTKGQLMPARAPSPANTQRAITNSTPNAACAPTSELPFPVQISTPTTRSVSPASRMNI